MRNNKGFTLAEVLITLGVIGVVAAMTIPGLINNYKAARLRTQFLKSYSTIQQAFKQMEADDVSTNPADYDRGNSPFFKTFKNYFKVAVTCVELYTKGGDSKFLTTLPCYNYTDTSAGYKTLVGNTYVNKSYFDDAQYVLNDGTLIIVDTPDGNGWIWVLADLNGYGSPPNRLGYDLFVFEFQDGELRTMGDIKTQYNDMNKYCSYSSTEALNGIACAQKAKENSDYFKEIVNKTK